MVTNLNFVGPVFTVSLKCKNGAVYNAVDPMPVTGVFKYV